MRLGDLPDLSQLVLLDEHLKTFGHTNEAR